MSKGTFFFVFNNPELMSNKERDEVRSIQSKLTSHLGDVDACIFCFVFVASLSITRHSAAGTTSITETASPSSLPLPTPHYSLISEWLSLPTQGRHYHILFLSYKSPRSNQKAIYTKPFVQLYLMMAIGRVTTDWHWEGQSVGLPGAQAIPYK